MSVPARGRRSTSSIGGGAFERGVLALVVVVAVLAPPSGSASAHAIVESVEPADGSALMAAPTEVAITFSEPMLDSGLTVDVTTSAAIVPGSWVEITAPDRRRAVVHLGSMAEGTYQIRVAARDEEDLHEVIARTSFAIGRPAPAASAPVIAGPEPMESAAHWLFAAGLALLVGVTAVRTRWPDVPIDRPRRLHSLVVLGGASVLVGRVGALAARALALGGPPDDAVRTVIGTADARRLVLVGIALACMWLTEQSQRAPWLDVRLRATGHLSCRLALAWISVVNLAVLASWGGHSALDGSPSALTTVAKSSHLLGLGLWVGVLGVVLAISANPATRRSALTAMSRVAVAGAAVTVISGVVLTSRLVVSVTALLATTYGLLLVVKLGLISLGVGAGIAMRGRRRAVSPFAELGALAAVVLVGSAMATATPAIDRAFTDQELVVARVEPAVAAEDLLLQARAIPAQPGDNTVELRVVETRRPSLGAITSIDIVVDGTTFSTTPNDRGVGWIEHVALPPGETTIEAVVRRRGTPDTSATLMLATVTPTYVHPTWVSSARIDKPLLAAAGFLAVVAVAAAQLARRRRLAGAAIAPSVPTGDRPLRSGSTLP